MTKWVNWVLKAPDYSGVEDGLGRYEWFFRRTNVTQAVTQVDRVGVYPLLGLKLGSSRSTISCLR